MTNKTASYLDELDLKILEYFYNNREGIKLHELCKKLNVTWKKIHPRINKLFILKFIKSYRDEKTNSILLIKGNRKSFRIIELLKDIQDISQNNQRVDLKFSKK